MRRLSCLAAVLAMVLAGCRGAQPGDGFESVSSDVAARTGGAEVRWNRDAEAAAAIELRLDELLGQPLSVESAVQIALLNNRALQATIEELGVARADLIEAGLLENPVLGVSARFPDTSGSTNLEFTITQSFLELFVVGARKNLAAAQFEHARLRVTNSALELAWKTESAYYTAQASQQLLALKQTIAEAARLKRDLAIKQREAGNISELDSARQEATAGESHLAVTIAEAEFESRREQLNRLLGLAGPRTLWTLAADSPTFGDNDPDAQSLEHQALRDRIELAIARQELSVVNRALELARKGFVTDLDLGISAEREPEGFWVTGPVLQIELPIFDHRGVRIERIESQQRQARHMLAALETNAMSEVREACSQLSAARAKVVYLCDEVLPLRQRILKLSQEQYNAMLLGVYELLASRGDEVDAQALLIEATRDYLIARTALNKVVGGTLGTQPAVPTSLPAPATMPEEAHEHHHEGGSP